MQWSQAAPSSAIFTFDQLSYHLKLDDDVSASADEQAYVLDLQAAAVEFAEESLYASLVTRTITATFFGGEPLELPRGPVQSITSVTDENGNAVTDYTLERRGRQDVLIVPRQHFYWLVEYGTSVPRHKLTVVYQAGFGDTAASTPADIRQAIRVHVGTMYARRESVTDQSLMAVPHSLEQFYRLKARKIPVG